MDEAHRKLKHKLSNSSADMAYRMTAKFEKIWVNGTANMNGETNFNGVHRLLGSEPVR